MPSLLSFATYDLPGLNGGIYTDAAKKCKRGMAKFNEILQKGRSIGHNQWTWAMENRDNRIEDYRANKKD